MDAGTVGTAAGTKPTTMAGLSPLTRGEQPARPANATTPAAKPERMRCDATMTAPPPSPPGCEG